AAAPLVSLGLAGAVVSVLKPFVDRARPPLGLHLVTENEPSFPSGHTTDSTALLVTLGLITAIVVFRRPLARVLSVVLSILLSTAIGMSRLLLGVHWPTDVAAGLALGTMIAIAVSAVAVRVGARHSQLPSLPESP